MRAKRDWQFYASTLVLVAVVVVGAGAMLAAGSASTTGIPNYYFRAQVTEVRPNPNPPEPNPITSIEAWHVGDIWRWEHQHLSRQGSVASQIWVQDGDIFYSYDPWESTYYLEQTRDSEAVSFMGVVGFIPAESISDFIAMQASAESYQGATIGETETLLGRTVRAVEIRFLLGERVDFRSTHLTITYWIEPETMLALAADALIGSSETRHEIVELEVDPSIDANSLVFVPPAGAKRLDPPPASPANRARIVEGDPDVPNGFLTPAYLPDGYALTARETDNLSNDEPAVVKLVFRAGRLENGAFRELTIEQSEAVLELPTWTQLATDISFGEHDLFYLHETYRSRLAWLEGDLLVIVSANDLSLEEMLSIAEAMR